MKTKIVYTVVSGKGDIYLPQAMVAAYSARKYNPNAEIILVVDTDTSLVIDQDLPGIKKYLNDVIVVDVPEGMSKMHKSRYLKTTLRNVVKGDFLYIDTDTVVTADLSAIDDCKADVACALDRHALVHEHTLANGIAKDIKPFGLTLNDLKDRYFNAGVTFVKDTEKANNLFNKWYECWEKYRHSTRGIDQPPMALANKECGYVIEELDGKWNCQLSDDFINYLADAKILHYFASNGKSPYRLFNDSVFKEVMENGDVPEWLKKVLDHPKSFFTPKHLLVYGDDVRFCRTYLHVMFVYHKRVFGIFERLAKLMATRHF